MGYEGLKRGCECNTQGEEVKECAKYMIRGSKMTYVREGEVKVQGN